MQKDTQCDRVVTAWNGWKAIVLASGAASLQRWAAQLLGREGGDDFPAGAAPGGFIEVSLTG
jgi:hypothetical protein